MERVPEIGVLTHAVAVAADRHDVTVMDQAVDQRGGHDLAAKYPDALFKAFVGGQHRRRVLVAARHKPKEEHRAGATDREVDSSYRLDRRLASDTLAA